jgi:hypothetical protein
MKTKMKMKMKVKRQSIQVRLRLPHEAMDRLNRLASELRGDLGRQVPRSAVLRALVMTSMSAAECRKIVAAQIDVDPVRRGRLKEDLLVSPRKA